MFFDLLYPALWVGIAAVGLGYASRVWTRKTAKSFAAAQAAAERRATQLEAAFNGSLAKLEAGLVARDRQLRALIAPLKSESGLSIESYELKENSDHLRRMDRLQNDLDFVKNHLSSYLGAGTGLTHLIDETPIYVNTNDFGCPSNFINGGRYEEEYYAVLASFRKPNSIFLDIGANLGVYSLRMAPLLRKGKVFAFEPNTAIRTLFERSIHLNGLADLVKVYEVGASDKDEKLKLYVPEGHTGGASVVSTGSGVAGMEIEVRRLDGILADIAGFDIAKIDVEGHELSALRGMQALLSRSPNAVIIFEKLSLNSSIESDLVNLFRSHQMTIYRVDGAELVEMDLQEFSASSAYFIAAKRQVIGTEKTRNFLEIFPDDMHIVAGQVVDHRLIVDSHAGSAALLFHGPYWYLPRGTYVIQVEGEFNDPVSLTLAERFGYHVADFEVSNGVLSLRVAIDRDLTKFEIVGRSIRENAKFSLSKIRLTRIG